MLTFDAPQPRESQRSNCFVDAALEHIDFGQHGSRPQSLRSIFQMMIVKAAAAQRLLTSDDAMSNTNTVQFYTPRIDDSESQCDF